MKQEPLRSIREVRSAISRGLAGFSTVEVLLSAAVFSLLVTALVGAYLYGEEATMLAGNRARATLLAQEGLEAVQNIRDANFSALSDGTYGLTTAGNQWNLSGASDTTGLFTRSVTIATVDADRKSVTAQVSWQQNTQRADTVTLASRLTYWQKVVSVIGNWALPSQTGTYDATGNADGLKVAVSGNYAYIIRNVSGSQNFLILDISTPASPTLVGQLTLAGTPVNLAVSGNYAYVTNTNTGGELQIVNVTTPASPSLTGTYNSPAVASGQGIAVSGTVAYLGVTTTSANEFFTVNVSNPASPTLLGSVKLIGTPFEIKVSGNYAYIASSHNSQELQIVNVATPATPSITASLDFPTNTDALAVAVLGGTAFIGQGSNFYSVNVTTPASPVLLNTLAVGGTINDIDVDPTGTYAFIATAGATTEFRTINITNLSSMSVAGTIDITGSNIMYGVVYQSTQDRAYVVGNPNTSEVFVFKPN